MMQSGSEIWTSWSLWMDLLGEKGITIVQGGCDQSVDPDGCAVGSKGWTEAADTV